MSSKKKILITTVYSSENCGSFLQAWSLYYILKQNGYDVAFLKRKSKGTSHSFGLHLINALKDVLNFRFSHSFIVLKEWFVFDKLQDRLRIVSRNSKFYREASLQIIGSDTLWNFEDDYFQGMSSAYLGNDFFPRSSITYAVSAANTSVEMFLKVARKQGRKCINKFLVRDLHTADLVNNAYKEESEIVCDPTMLLTPTDFKILEKPKPAIDTYLLIYCFGDITSMKDSILSYAKLKGLKTVSFLTKRDWCDYSVEEDPQLMVAYYRYASCVVSNTFHGTALSIIYEKPFAVIDDGKNKVKELLQLYRMQERLIKAPDSLNECLDCIITERDKNRYDFIKNKSSMVLFNTISNEVNRKA